MKLLTLCLTALAATSVQAATLQRWCAFPGQGCATLKIAADSSHEVKRSADALAESMAKITLDRWCHFPGQGCVKVKRAMEVADEVKRSTDALAAAMAALDEVDEE
ncbi:hypothetical protein P175DRAFT_0440648 [Aspergillus ochraceoroseus IBT 24754]|uniref:Mating alpha-pheromone PpgA n=3 Tax=Aspergillus subgen. Nidulantes TaxID=2720870 RepID=A0A0F8X4M9_9EURO|nr:uncharacterized protein P175DRAFT_0440648 [Aspergillus ochraceoroseus IBT 24754]KKK18517.1 hypothetical protein ARAM_006656 [Aspergillus rambellii]KKK26129.1 hypothetical protein AOCH_005376 [Aspergillus ochraceoroseus]PTU19212.1 hypothetical protein P175DRAFT_0440648 [Aspergillus ochraceoroseus IBT 24754]